MKKMDLCPKNRRNCVSSLDGEAKKHATDPLPYTGSGEKALQKLHDLLRETNDCEVVRSESYYLHCVFKTIILRFKDDVEFIINETNEVIDVRSASRIGHYDFETNRKRIEEIRQQFSEA
ncbi:DUF1499 domain-containing protein [Bacillus sp. H-16]|uniref:DUF1499 domain-containing protein n=1 Tax=Alteribacter salitolerans TaxID=2912333 RepID=UPI001963192B|nr:DUF1499 domain-containing protein [Alteribacter salitolerans]MBM7094472.1 DUF1499 domain-containing protein [Alteribacter salitolerans]